MHAGPRPLGVDLRVVTESTGGVLDWPGPAATTRRPAPGGEDVPGLAAQWIVVASAERDRAVVVGVRGSTDRARPEHATPRAATIGASEKVDRPGEHGN